LLWPRAAQWSGVFNKPVAIRQLTFVPASRLARTFWVFSQEGEEVLEMGVKEKEEEKTNLQAPLDRGVAQRGLSVTR
jgi:hypothetical protein